MRLAGLFWCYKAPRLCRNRLRLLRRHNPALPVFVLYGGPPGRAGRFAEALAPFADDFYAFPERRSARWKWRHGDRVIARWHERRGQHLRWDTVVTLQWDALVFDRLARLFASLRPGELFASGLRPVEEVAAWWYWAAPSKPRHADERAAFARHMRRRYGYDGALWCCQFIVAALPRSFLRRYARVERPELGFLEYRLPTFARALGVPLRRLPRFDDCWQHDPDRPAGPRRPLNADGHDVPLTFIWKHLKRPGGARLFHPFERFYPMDARSVAALAWQSLTEPVHLKRTLRRRLLGL